MAAFRAPAHPRIDFDVLGSMPWHWCVSRLIWGHRLGSSISSGYPITMTLPPLTTADLATRIRKPGKALPSALILERTVPFEHSEVCS